MTGSQSAGMRWLIDHAHTGQAAPVRDRDVLRQAVSLADLCGDRAALRTLSGGPQIAAAWQIRRRTVATYADCLAAEAAHVRPTSALVSLLHVHHVRAHGINPDSERLCHRLARAVALAWTARHDLAQGCHR
jgi:lantibiotic biosynthesis protein